MDYKNIYNQLIEKSITQSRKRYKKSDSKYVYYENHHIIPECFFINRKRKGPAGWLDGNPNAKENLVLLTPEEHYLAHQLLVKMYPENKKLVYALFALLPSSKKHQRSNKMYGWIRRKYPESIKGKVGTMTGKTHTDATKAKMSKSQAGKVRSEETCEKISLAHINKPSKLKGRIKNIPKPKKSKSKILTSENIEQLRRMTEKVKKKVCIFGIIYSSIREASRALGINEETLRRRCHLEKYSDYNIIGDKKCPA
jgi:hypothetical protein